MTHNAASPIINEIDCSEAPVSDCSRNGPQKPRETICCSGFPLLVATVASTFPFR